MSSQETYKKFARYYDLYVGDFNADLLMQVGFQCLQVTNGYAVSEFRPMGHTEKTESTFVCTARKPA